MALTTSERTDLVEKVIQAAGGLERFNQVRSIEVVVDGSGRLFSLKGYPNRSLLNIYIDTKSRRAVFHNFGGRLEEPNLRWIWTSNRVWVERADGTILDSRNDPRKHFNGRVLQTPWDDMSLLYFRGYAIWNYLMAPYYFSWPDFTFRDVGNHIEAGQIWRVLEVTYPNEFPTHCKVQKFYFDKNYRLRRLDYETEVIKSGLAAHYVYDEKEISGMVFPMLRRVVKIHDGQYPGGPSAVLLNIHSIIIRDEPKFSKL